MSERSSHEEIRLLEDRYSDRFFSVFSWYVARMFRKSFHAVRIEPESIQLLERTNSHDGPVIILGNHPGWWDPLVAVLLSRVYLPSRPMLAAMDRAELERFGILRRVGVFGIEPDNPATLPAQVEFLRNRFVERPKATFWITPQGDFTDVRQRLRLRPGAASVASRLEPSPRVLALAMDYCFWNDRQPELFTRLMPVKAEPRSGERLTTTDWHRAMTATMQVNQDALTERVLQRNPDDWALVLESRGHQRTNPVYDLWLRLRGRSGELGSTRNRSPR